MEGKLAIRSEGIDIPTFCQFGNESGAIRKIHSMNIRNKSSQVMRINCELQEEEFSPGLQI